MASTILIKRGLKANLPILERGELAYATDTKELFIGVLAEPTVVGDNVLISDITKNDFDTLITTGLVWNSGDEELSVDFADGTEALEVNNIVKVMNPQRTDEAITARLDATLATSNVASESFVTGEIDKLPGTGLSLDSETRELSIDNPFNPSGTYANLRAQATTATDVGLGNVTNESKTTMFTNPTFTGTVTIPDPTNATDATNKRYVDELVEGLKTAPSVHAATTGNLSGTYDNGTAGVGATLNLGATATLTIDGESVWVLYDGILLKDQTNKAENGRYFVSQVGDGSTDWILTRCPVCDEADEIPGRYVFVNDGVVNAGTGWVQVVDDPNTFVVGTDDIDVYQFSGAGTYSAGTGLTLTGTEFAIDTATTMDLASNQTVTGVKTFNEVIQGSVTGIEETRTNTVLSIWTGSESDYNTLVNASQIDSNTLYFIEE